MAKPECNELATKLVKIYGISEALTSGWKYLEPERRAESLAGLEKRVSDLIGGSIDNPLMTADVESAKRVLQSLEILRRYNEGEGTMHNISEKLLPAVIDMVTESILNCGCREAGYMVERDTI